MATETRRSAVTFKKLTYAAAASFALAVGTPCMAIASTAPSATSAHAATHVVPTAMSAVRGVTVLLAQTGADPTGQMQGVLQKVVGMFTGGPAKLLVVLAIVGTCITLLQRPDHHELIGNLTKVVLIGVIIIFAQSIVGFMFGGI